MRRPGAGARGGGRGGARVDAGAMGCSRAEGQVRSVVGILVANVLGSFLMGFLTENKAHKLWFEAPKMPVSFLPENHFIQVTRERKEKSPHTHTHCKHF